MKLRSSGKEDRQFVSDKDNRLLSEDIIEPSNSPWRAQVLVAKNSRHKKRLVIDFPQTVNKCTNSDAYPLSKINELVNKIARYRVFSTVDLKSAYHQIPL